LSFLVWWEAWGSLSLQAQAWSFGGQEAMLSRPGGPQAGALIVRLRESSTFKGKRKLTKRGESELRRLLYCAAKPARSLSRFETYHQRQLDKGLRPGNKIGACWPR